MPARRLRNRHPGDLTEKTYGDLEPRLDAVEKALGDGYIRYDIDNVGEWLLIETTGGDDLTSGYGLKLALSQGLLIQTSGSLITAETGGGGYSIDTGSGAAAGLYQVDAGDILIRSHFGHDLDLEVVDGGGMGFSSHGGTFTIISSDAGGGGDIYFNLGSPSDASDGSFTVDQASHFIVDAWASGTAISLVTRNVGGDIDIEAGDDINIQAADEITILAGSNLGLRVGAGKTFTVYNHLGVAKLQWTEGTADLHIPTGGTVIANL